MAQVHHRARRPSIRILGVSLIEALVAMAVMAFGMLAVMGVQTTLRLNGDISKQRSEATRIAERELERLRSFKDVLPPAPAVPGDTSLYWSQVAQVLGQEVDLEGAASNTTYVMNRKVFTPAGSSQRAISVEITWQDSTGNTQTVALGDTLAGAAPVLSGLISMPAVRTSASQNRNRHPTIPPRAHDMGNGESAFKPLEDFTVAWTFNNTTGVITSVCLVSGGQTSADLIAEDLKLGANCTATSAQLLSGFIRFNLRGDTVKVVTTSTLTPMMGGSVLFTINNASPQRVVSYCVDAPCTPPLTPGTSPVIAPPFDAVNDGAYSLMALDSEDPHWPSLPLAISAGVTSGNRPTPSDECFSNAPLNAATAIGRTAVEYFCIIYPETPEKPKKIWSGTPIVGTRAYLDDSTHPWAIGSTVGTYRVCRYTTATSNPKLPDGTDAPTYTNVSGNLINQNFLIIAGQKSCPTDGAVNPAAGDFVNSNTLPHQPSS